MTFEELFDHTMEFKNCELLEGNADYVLIKTRVNETDTNLYGYAHGGYLFTLCDTLCGLMGYYLGYYVVTQQANINYLKPARSNDELYIRAEVLHSGRSSDVCDVKITDQSDELIAKAQFTLFNTREIDIK
ncbi:MAG: PaaI family thioesterase [Erysipelotrichaceae bacterium]|nr:PaaI family thioesterase [Erysipelotrichaceae bacterium]